ncbi:hypothetical protein J6590_092749 [Homalodisca vitripennis]|nr:hypothetical protein J6590_092749 [Homalodisca vitripennis]
MGAELLEQLLRDLLRKDDFYAISAQARFPDLGEIGYVICKAILWTRVKHPNCTGHAGIWNARSSSERMMMTVSRSWPGPEVKKEGKRWCWKLQETSANSST